MRNARGFLGAVLVALLVVIPLGFPTFTQSSDIRWQWDEYGKLIVPAGYRVMPDWEYMIWYCMMYPDDCSFKFVLAEDDGDGPGGGGC